jgi:hypothetical protein
MLQFKEKLRRLETTKISKFRWSVLVMFVAVGLFAPQKAEAAPHGVVRFSGNVALSIDPDTNNFKLVFSSVTITGATGSFADFNNTALNLQTFEIDAKTHEINPLQQTFEWFNLGGESGPGAFQFNHPDGVGLVTLGPPTSSVALSFSGLTEISGEFEPHPPWFGHLKGTGTNATEIPFSAVVGAPDSGSALGLLAIGLVGLVAVEGLRRKIATRQNRYA